MIITKLQNGLGNQMFQYAIGRNLSLRYNTNLKLDLSFYQGLNSADIPRQYLLNHFNINAEIATRNDFKKIGIPNNDASLFPKIKRKLFRIIESARPPEQRKLILEKNFYFQPSIFKTKNNIFINGNWQSEKYFFDIEKIIRKDFTLKKEISNIAKSLQTEIEKKNSVSIHIRRGDYVKNKKTRNLHGNVCTLGYYQNATATIEKKISDPTYFVFSDDIDWVKENLELKKPAIYVSGQGIPDCEELVIMSKCLHNIIANSTFSWWSAWLNQNPEKIVITPKKWFNAPTDTRDLIPSRWIKI